MPEATGVRPDHLPPLIVVGGAPGSGKTTLARRLGRALALPVITKDDLKEVLYDTLGVSDAEESARLGRAAVFLLYAITDRLLEAGTGLIVESNFHRRVAEASLAPRVARSRAALVHCSGDAETIIRRYRERAERRERHPGHQDLQSVPRLADQLAAGLFEPLALDVPVLQVDTTTDVQYVPTFEEIVRFARRLTRPG